MTVEEMIERMSASEFFTWAAYYGSKGRKEQSPAQIANNIGLAFAARKKKK